MVKQITYSLKNRKYFRTIFFSVMAVCLTILISSVFALYFTFSKDMIKSLNKVNLSFLSKVTHTMTSIDFNAKSTALNIYRSAPAIELLNKDNLEEYQKVKNLSELNYEAIMNENIYSMYLYNGLVDEVYMIGAESTISKTNEFYDKNVVEMLDNKTKYMSEPFYRVIKKSPYSNETVEVYTYIYIDKLNSNGKPLTATIINLSVDKIFSFLKDSKNAYGDVDNNYMLFNEQNNVLYSNLENSICENTIEHEINKIPKEENISGYKIAKIDDVKYVIAYYTYNSPKWTTVNVTKYSDVISNIHYYKILLILILIGSSLIGSACIFILSIILYSPIKKIKNTLNQELEISGKETKEDDINWILHSISNTAKKLDTLSDYKDRSITATQTTLLKKQLFYSHLSNNEFFIKCKNQNIDFRESDNFVFIYSSLDSTKDNINKKELNLLNYALMNSLTEVLCIEFRTQFITTESSNELFLIAFEEGTYNYEAIKDSLKSALSVVQTLFMENFSVDLSFSVSGICTEPELFPLNYKNVKDMLNYECIYDNECIIFDKDIDFNNLENKMLNIDKLKNVEALIRSGNIDEIKKILDEYFEELKHYQYNNIVSSLILISNTIFNVIWSIEKSGCYSFGFDFTLFNSNILKIKHLATVKDVLIRLIEKTIKYTYAINQSKTTRIIEQIADYIDNNYKDVNLSSKLLADKFHISTGYAGKLFKQKYNNSISGYITSVRLKKSTDYLVKTNLTIEDILQKIGWENSKYYYTQFKKVYGVSPSNYRIDKNQK